LQVASICGHSSLQRLMLFGLWSSSNFGARGERALPACPQAARGAWHRRDEVVMGTAIHVELWSDDERSAVAAMRAVIDEMHRIDAAMSPFKPQSELSRINRDAGAGAVRVSDEMFELIARSIEFSERSDGAFDITYAAVGHLYDYRGGVRPSEEAIAHARGAVGYRHLVLDHPTQSVRFARDGMRIDLGGFAKGHAVDNAAAILARRGIRHAIVSAGGDSRVIGDRRGRPWSIAVRDPRRAGGVVAVLPLSDTAISTSGDYERYFEQGGVRHHHLIDPKTGYSPTQLRSVTILAPDGLTAEGLSKSLFVLGLERGMRLVESQPGVDAVVVDAAGALHYSSGLLSQPPQTRQ
jgi:thiamine biosynthesis lipoprotein